MSRVFVADDHPMIQGAIESLLRGCGHEIVGHASSGSETLERLKEVDADIVVLDVQMPGGSGIEVLRSMRSAGDARHVILLTASIADEAIREAIDLGVRAIVLKTSDPSNLIDAIDAIERGRTWIDKQIVQRVSALTGRGRRRGLTERERALIALVREGLKNREIADRLNTTEGTVKAYLHAIFDKVGVENRTELAMKAADIIGP